MAYDSSFAGVGFDVESLNGALARSAPVDVSVRHIPGGADNYIDVGGAQPVTVTLNLFFTAYADYVSLEAQRGAQGTLTYVDGTYTALLTKLERTYNALGTARQTRATATFLLL